MTSAKDDFKRSFLTINTTGFFFSYATIIPSVILPLYALSIGATLFQISLILGVFFGMNSATTVIMGSLSDILGTRKPFLMFSLIGSAIALCLIPFISIPVYLIVLMGLLGVIISAYPPNMFGLVSEISAKTEKGKNMGILNTSISLGWALGSFFSGLIEDLFGFALSFYIGCSFAVFAAAIILIFLKETKTGIIKDRSLKTIWHKLKRRIIPGCCGEEIDYLKKNGLNWLFAAVFTRYFAYWGVLALVTVFFSTLVPIIWVGILIGLNNGLQAVTMTPIGKLSDKIGRKPIIYLGLIGTSAVLVLYAIANGLFILIIAQILLSFAFAGIFTGESAFVADVAPEFKHNEIMGFLSFVLGFASLTGSLFAGFIAEILGIRIMFMILSILPVFGSLIVLFKVKETIV
ncbi:MFS transporter [Candidatus Borrarchaeum sp.]|uniref:MFS transporter n=1 Tax=Candidatus Borrarchaeum sp. TaxID=2846742 RepID=UPI002580C413|nr:MFS transporter [Candidatus Borrarchaeum sp.]